MTTINLVEFARGEVTGIQTEQVAIKGRKVQVILTDRTENERGREGGKLFDVKVYSDGTCVRKTGFDDKAEARKFFDAAVSQIQSAL